MVFYSSAPWCPSFSEWAAYSYAATFQEPAADTSWGQQLLGFAQALASFGGTTINKYLVRWVAKDWYVGMSIVPGCSADTTPNFIWEITMWYALFFFIIGIVITAIKVVITGKSAGLVDIFYSIINWVAASSLWLALIGFGTMTTNVLSAYIVSKANLSALDSMIGVAPIFVLQLLLTVFMLIVSIAFSVVLVSRDIILLVIAGFGPLSAALSMTKFGKAWQSKLISTSIALMLFKPFSALLWTTSINLLASPATKNVSALRYIALPLAVLCMCLFALPATIKMFSPSGISFGSGDGGGSTGAGVVIAGGTLALAGLTGGASLGATGGANAGMASGSTAASGGAAAGGGSGTSMASTGNGGNAGNTPGGAGGTVGAYSGGGSAGLSGASSMASGAGDMGGSEYE